VFTGNGKSRSLGRFVIVLRGGGDVERVRRAVAVEVESPPSRLYAVEEPYRRFRERYPLPAQLI